MIMLASQLLRTAGIETWDDSEIPTMVAEIWNGSYGLEEGSDLTYAEAIRLALQLLENDAVRSLIT
jgi:hypothetical protein